MGQFLSGVDRGDIRQDIDLAWVFDPDLDPSAWNRSGVLAAFLCEVDFTLRWRQAEEASRNLQLQLFISFKFPCSPLQK